MIYTVKVSFSQIYNEQVYDLLTPPPHPPLRVRYIHGKFHTENLTQFAVQYIHTADYSLTHTHTHTYVYILRYVYGHIYNIYVYGHIYNIYVCMCMYVHVRLILPLMLNLSFSPVFLIVKPQDIT
jgi:hypothetical protein